MRYYAFVKEVEEELEKDRIIIAKKTLKNRLSEIRKVKKLLSRLEGEYEALLEKDIDEMETENESIYL